MSFLAAGVLGGGSLLLGGIQAISGHKKEKKAENAIENLQSPTYNPNASILDYYQKALNRYNTNPYQSAQYQYGIQQGNRNTAAGINALQDRQSAVGGVGRLIAQQNNNAIQQGITAENEQSQRFNQLGGATQMKAGDEQYGFNINKLMPYQQKLQLLGLKAQGGAQMENAGISNIFNGLGSAAVGMTGFYGGSNIFGKKSNGASGSYNPIDMNSITGGVGGNWSTLQGGSPFSINSSDYQTPYGE